jgi:hypothetical protein
MSTSQQTPGLLKPAGTNKISTGTLGYIRARHRQRAYDLLVKEFKKSGITQADLARRLDKPREVISRLLARPGNWESDTFSDMIFAISGAIVSFGADYPLTEQAGVTVVTAQDVTEIARLEKRKEKKPEIDFTLENAARAEANNIASSAIAA